MVKHEVLGLRSSTLPIGTLRRADNANCVHRERVVVHTCARCVPPSRWGVVVYPRSVLVLVKIGGVVDVVTTTCWYLVWSPNTSIDLSLLLNLLLAAAASDLGQLLLDLLLQAAIKRSSPDGLLLDLWGLLGHGIGAPSRFCRSTPMATNWLFSSS